MGLDGSPGGVKFLTVLMIRLWLFQPSTATDDSIAGAASQKREEKGSNQVVSIIYIYRLTIQIFTITKMIII